MQLDADIAGLAKHLQKPLRALWISQNSRIWTDQTPDPGELPFTPVILVSTTKQSILRSAVKNKAVSIR